MLLGHPIVAWTLLGFGFGLPGFTYFWGFPALLVLVLGFSLLPFGFIHKFFGVTGALELCDSRFECATAVSIGFYTAPYLAVPGFIIGVFVWLHRSGKSLKRAAVVLYVALLALSLFSYSLFGAQQPFHPLFLFTPLILVAVALIGSRCEEIIAGLVND